jgi:hypothetical protein
MPLLTPRSLRLLLPLLPAIATLLLLGLVLWANERIPAQPPQPSPRSGGEQTTHDMEARDGAQPPPIWRQNPEPGANSSMTKAQAMKLNATDQHGTWI